MDIQLFTVKDYDQGLRPERLRVGTRLKDFHYFAGAEFCFVGVDVLGVTHLWRANGRKNGKVNNMPTDLVKVVTDPDAEVFYLIRTPSGGFYASDNLEKLKSSITLASQYDVYQFEVNFQKQVLADWEFVETVKQPKKQ